MEIEFDVFKKFIPNVILVDEVIKRYLNNSKRYVILDGIDLNNENFDELQRLHCLGTMQLEDVSGIPNAGFSGNADAKKISSLSVAGVSLSYQNSSTGAFISRTTGRTGFMGQYDELLKKIRGIGIIVE